MLTGALSSRAPARAPMEVGGGITVSLAVCPLCYRSGPIDAGRRPPWLSRKPALEHCRSLHLPRTGTGSRLGGRAGPRTRQDADFGERPVLRYPQAESPAIDGISFTIKPGERVALVGANGSGKTTLVKVLLGLFGPTKGEVRYGELDLARASRDELWNQTAAVFQDYTRFAFTLGENIGFGRVDRMSEQDEVERAARQGGAHTIAEHLPGGYGTLLTKEFTGGTELSGGEWQRVAISRGFMRNAAMVVLDEPTASLDPKAEADVFRRFLTMAGGCSTILVSHRLGSARLCDRILVLKEGRLVENGTHDELLSRAGEYARMWALQAQWYGAEPIPM